ncbi:hypothetical protein D3C86_2056020 [compost metagenome]
MAENLEHAAAGGFGDQSIVLCFDSMHLLRPELFPAALVEDAVTFDVMYRTNDIVKRIGGQRGPVQFGMLGEIV